MNGGNDGQSFNLWTRRAAAGKQIVKWKQQLSAQTRKRGRRLALFLFVVNSRGQNTQWPLRRRADNTFLCVTAAWFTLTPADVTAAGRSVYSTSQRRLKVWQREESESEFIRPKWEKAPPGQRRRLISLLSSEYLTFSYEIPHIFNL